MVTTAPSINTAALQKWLKEGKRVSILDVRPPAERMEWFIPGSLHLNVYDKLKADDADALSGLYLDKKIPVVVVCAAGKTSQKAANLLIRDGYEAFSLEGGMKSWSLAWNTATLTFEGYQVLQVRRTGKGCLSYIVASGREALVVDASLPIEVYRGLLQENHWTLKAVVETHVHADHLSRSKQLAETMNVVLYLPEASKVDFPYRPLGAADVIAVGEVSLRVIATPGHTMDSTSYLLNNKVLFSGDTLFTKSIGRPDLKADEAEARVRSGLLFDSVQRLLALPDDLIVLPAHSSTPVAFDHHVVCATLGEIKNTLPILRLARAEFIDTVLQKIPEPPQNYLTIAALNSSGDSFKAELSELETGANRCAL